MVALAKNGYVYIRGRGKEELFDETNDPGERHNWPTIISKEPLLDGFRSEIEQAVPPR